MRSQPRNIVFCAQSLDGYIADRDGGIDWLEIIPNPDGDSMGYPALMAEIDAIVMGRRTFEKVLSFGIAWPYEKPVYVLSSSRKTVPQELEAKVAIIQGTVAEVLDQIHSAGHMVLYIDGGSTVQMFLREGMIDDMRITTIPIVLGDGIPLFGRQEVSEQFDLVSSEVFLSQLVHSRYQKRRHGGTGIDGP